jgi:thymidylate synthase (FAD)
MVEIVKPSVSFINQLDSKEIYKTIEKCGRIAYQSQDKTTENSDIKFIKSLISRGHGSVLEHVYISIKIVCDRGVTHELVRHRLASYTQESTRYCNYSKLGLKAIKPMCQTIEGELIWDAALKAAEEYYNDMIKAGETPEIARSILPAGVKSEIVATMNIRQWRHVLNQRLSKNAHPQIREIMLMLKEIFIKELPILFEDIK